MGGRRPRAAAALVACVPLLSGSLAQEAEAPAGRGAAGRLLAGAAGRCPLSGVQFELSLAALPEGWATAYEAPYGEATALADVRPGGGQLGLSRDFDCILLGAKREASELSLHVAAFGDRFRFENGSHFWDNDVFWYSVDGLSAGFAGSSDVLLQPGDQAPFDGATRLSWHLGNGRGGYRAGRHEGLDSNFTWQKVVMHGPWGTFCDESVCAREEAMKLLDLPEFCRGRSCTPAECCVQRGTCSAGDCPLGYILKPHLPEMCAHAMCLQSECCMRAPRCSASVCSGGNISKVIDLPPYGCQSHTCTAEECCERAGTCTSSVCQDGFLLRSPPHTCAAATCSEAECCYPAARCEPSLCPPGLGLRAIGLPSHCGSQMCQVEQCCEQMPPSAGVSGASLADLDLDPGFLGGNITWLPPPSDGTVTHFAVYLGSEPEDPGNLSHCGNVSWGTNALSLPAGTPAAPWLVVHACNRAGFWQSRFGLSDVALPAPGPLSFRDLDLDAGELGGELQWTEPWAGEAGALAAVCRSGVALGVRGGGPAAAAAFFLGGRQLPQATAPDGVSVAVLAEGLAAVARVGLFHTGGAGDESRALERFLGALPRGATVLLAAAGLAARHLHGGARAALGAFGSTALGFGPETSYALIGTKGSAGTALEASAAPGSGSAATVELACPVVRFAAYRLGAGAAAPLGAAPAGARRLALPAGTAAAAGAALAVRAASALAEGRAAVLAPADAAAAVEAVRFASDGAGAAAAVSGTLSWRAAPGAAPVAAYRVYLAGADAGARLQVGADVNASWRSDYALRIPPGTPRGNFSRFAIHAVSELAEQSRPCAEVPLSGGGGSVALQVAMVGAVSVFGVARVASAAQAAQAAGKIVVQNHDLRALERCAARMETLKPQPTSVIGTFAGSSGETVTISESGEFPFVRDFVSPLFPGWIHHHHSCISVRHKGSRAKTLLHRHKACDNLWDNGAWVLRKVSNNAISIEGLGLSGEKSLLHRTPPWCSCCLKGPFRTVLRVYTPLLVLVGVSAMVLGLEYLAIGGLLLGFAVACFVMVVAARRLRCVQRLRLAIAGLPPAVVRAPFWGAMEVLAGLLPCVPAFMAGTPVGWVTGSLAVLGALAKARDADLLASLLELLGGAAVAAFCLVAKLRARDAEAGGGAGEPPGEAEGEQELLAVLLVASLLCVKGVDDWLAGVWLLYLEAGLPTDELLLAAERTAAATELGLCQALVLEALALGAVPQHMCGRLADALRDAATQTSRRGQRATDRVLHELYGPGSGWRPVCSGLARRLGRAIDAADGSGVSEFRMAASPDKLGRTGRHHSVGGQEPFKKRVADWLEELETSLRQLLNGPLAPKTIAHSRASASLMEGAVHKLRTHVTRTELCVGADISAGAEAYLEFWDVRTTRVALIAKEVKDELHGSHISSIDLCMARQRLDEMRELLTHMADTLKLLVLDECADDGAIPEATRTVAGLLDSLHAASERLQAHGEPRVPAAALEALARVLAAAEALAASRGRLRRSAPAGPEPGEPGPGGPGGPGERRRAAAEAELRGRAPGLRAPGALEDLEAAAAALCSARGAAGRARALARELGAAAAGAAAAAALLEAARGEAAEVLEEVVAARGRPGASLQELRELRAAAATFTTGGPVRALVLLQGLGSEALEAACRSLELRGAEEALHRDALEPPGEAPAAASRLRALASPPAAEDVGKPQRAGTDSRALDVHDLTPSSP